MELETFFTEPAHEPLSCVDMHTTAMPARIVIKGYPSLSGTLLHQREQAEKHHDHIRTRLLQEPRGHFDMFGAVLRPETEFTESGEAHMGLLYLNGEGYSKMCGHATIAVCRLLVDLHDEALFPRRKDLQYDPVKKTVRLVLHTLGGLVEAEVPAKDGGMRSDPARPVAFVAVPALALATDLQVELPPQYRWPELGDREHVSVSLAYVSAISCHISLGELGFPADTFRKVTDFQSLSFATRQLKSALNNSSDVRSYLGVFSGGEPGCIFGIEVEDSHLGSPAEGTDGAETGMYYFGDQHLDRSPTGSVVAARNSIKYAKGELGLGQSWTYHSILTSSKGIDHGFVGKTLREVNVSPNGSSGAMAQGVIVEVSGYAYYTGLNTYVIEKEDPISKDGFLVDHINKPVPACN